MIAWLVETLIVTSGLMLLVLLLRNPVRQSFGAKAAYALWLLPALRMVMPPMASLMPQSLPIASLAPTTGALSQMLRDRMLQLDPVAIAPAGSGVGAGVDTGAGFSWMLIAAALWLTGALVFAIWQILAYRAFCRRVLSGARVRRSPAKGIKLLASSRVDGPLAFGIMRRIIVFPQDALMRFDVEEHAMALAHELAHHRRGDLLANAFALGFVALHWCNPIAWYAHRAFRNDQEMACDADVIDAIRDRGLGHAYGRALVKCASGRQFSAICHLNTVDRLKRRLSMLSKQSPSIRRRMIGIALTGGLLVSGLALTASGEGMAAQVGAKVSEALPIPRKQDLLPSPSTARALHAADAAQLKADHAQRDADKAQRRADLARAAADAAAGRLPPEPPAPPAPPLALDTAQRKADFARKDANQARRRADLARASADALVPPVPPVPPLARAAPVPPAPPATPARAISPAPAAHISKQRQVIRVRNDYIAAVPSRAEIEAMVPVVEVTEGKSCGAGQQLVNTSETRVSIDGRTRNKISIMICDKAVARHARAEALEGLREARNEIAQERDLSAKMRNEITANLDRQIANLRIEKN